VRACAAAGQIAASVHGSERINQYGIVYEHLLSSLSVAIAIDDYPDAIRGPSVLALHRLSDNSPIHAVWGFPKGRDKLAVLITAYIPDPTRWSADFLTRKVR
jgi:hypothetical protein